MVWAAVGLGYKSPLIRLPLQLDEDVPIAQQSQKTINGRMYLKLCEDHLSPFLQEFGDEFPLASPPISLEDNAKPHACKLVVKELARLNINRFPHPPRSPDLNPIEPCWWIMKSGMRKLNQIAKNKEDLWEMAQEAWNSIPQWKIDRQVLKMRRRYELVIKSRGGKIANWHTM
ncbi:hypothetical protein CBS101457_004684 [Exobasidium rhododendri]|nr:hypothetical protein CBS101457_004684 [Exobasidium rhododendri]